MVWPGKLDFRAWEAPWQAIWHDKTCLTRRWSEVIRQKGWWNNPNSYGQLLPTHDWLSVKYRLKGKATSTSEKSDNAKCTKWSNNFPDAEEVHTKVYYNDQFSKWTLQDLFCTEKLKKIDQKSRRQVLLYLCSIIVEMFGGNVWLLFLFCQPIMHYKATQCWCFCMHIMLTFCPGGPCAPLMPFRPCKQKVSTKR